MLRKGDILGVGREGKMICPLSCNVWQEGCEEVGFQGGYSIRSVTSLRNAALYLRWMLAVTVANDESDAVSG